MKRREAFGLALAVAIAAQPSLAQDTGSGGSPVDPRKTEADIETAQANARKAQAEAKKAEQDLYTGIVTAAGNRGTVTVNAGAGTVEAASVASDALVLISRALDSQIIKARELMSNSKAAHSPDYCRATWALKTPSIVIATEAWAPDTGTVDLVYPSLATRISTAVDVEAHAKISISVVERELDSATKPKPPAGRTPAVVTPAGGVVPAALLAGASALMGAMKTDVELFGVTLTSGDAILLRTVAGEIKSQHKEINVFVPEISNPTRGAGKAVFENVALLDSKLSELTELQAMFSALAAKAISGATAAGEKTPIADNYDNIGKEITLFRAPLDAFVTSQQAWLAALVDVAKGKTLAQVAAEQAEIGCIIADGGVLVRVKSEVFGGSIFTRKNLWTTFGGKSIFVSAGSVVTYSFNDLWTGNFINSGVVKSMGAWKPITEAGPRGQVEATNFWALPAPPPAGRSQ